MHIDFLCATISLLSLALFVASLALCPERGKYFWLPPVVLGILISVCAAVISSGPRGSYEPPRELETVKVGNILVVEVDSKPYKVSDHIKSYVSPGDKIYYYAGARSYWGIFYRDTESYLTTEKPGNGSKENIND